MDLEAMQLLNLSPIPELSEIELSTMLDHLSGLSDINGDLTDRNVEDIIKEAEDLLDKSISSKVTESREVKKSVEVAENISDGIKQRIDSEDCNTQESNSNENKQYDNTINYVSAVNNTSNEDDSKHFNTPVEITPTKVYSPGGTTNHIKSTIDSLKEFSTLVEKKLSSQSENSSPTGSKKTKKSKKEFENTQVTLFDGPPSEKLTNKKEATEKPKTKPPDLTTKKSLDKSAKLLNCFDRLYQVKPVFLSTTMRPKVIDKTPKTVTKKKFGRKELKNVKKNCQAKAVSNKSLSEDLKSIQIHPYPTPPTFIDEEDLLNPDDANLNYFHSGNNVTQKRIGEDRIVVEHLSHHSNFERISNTHIQSKIDEKLILKVLEEMEEIKDQVRKVGAVSDYSGKEMKDEIAADSRQPEAEKNAGIQRLELQFSMLKEKYDYQLEKLEAENIRLKEALNWREKFLPQEMNVVPKIEEVRGPSESVSSENCKAPRNSPCSSFENSPAAVTSETREAFAQTEEEPKSGRREVGTDAEEILSDGRRTENKENVAGEKKKKAGKCKPFSDVNAHQAARWKTIVDHESQLLATMRGLQAEVTAKDKESRKLKSEIESLRKQMKKLGGTCKVENYRKCHAGTQTIALSHVLHKPYNPQDYEGLFAVDEVPQEFERENEDLRSRIKALEEDFELLKEKRITDLQTLHQAHEEEMAKLVSKLETQSALTRHLHSLLVNR